MNLGEYVCARNGHDAPGPQLLQPALCHRGPLRVDCGVRWIERAEKLESRTSVFYRRPTLNVLALPFRIARVVTSSHR